ncbi:hypothetical protein FDA94_03360 [Herbidospora galbida]|uniref:PH domain-containing protein n=1 Tax=Herbidospora galbida TaxID=2575442 RepID=A0A4U3MRF7_9ACTN|nr:hypothetical protein [Herbidospora galbida]TKK90816.1 hypothetical protein FDA94_03360 [Herbidospora galbida]
MKRVWRVRLWVRALSVLVLAYPVAAFLVPSWFNPTWDEGLPAEDRPWLIGTSLMMLVVMWAAFYARIEVADEKVRVVNPWRTHTFPLRDIVDMRPGPFGLVFELNSGERISAFAVGCTRTIAREPRWVGVARTVAGL